MDFTFSTPAADTSFDSPSRAVARPRDDEESPTFTGMVISPCSMYKEAGAGRVAADDVSPARFDQWLTATNLLVSRTVPSDLDAVDSSQAADAPSFCFGRWLQATEAAANSPSLSSRKSSKPVNSPPLGGSSHQQERQAGSPAWMQQGPALNDTNHSDIYASPSRHREPSPAPAEEGASPAGFEFSTPSARPSRSLQGRSDQEGQQQATGRRTNHELAWPCTGDGLPPPTRYFHTDGQRAYDSMAATPASCYDSATPLPGGAGVGACSGRLDYGSDEDSTPGSGFSSRTCQPEIGAMLARLALRPAQADIQQHGKGGKPSQGADYFRQLNAALPKSPEQRVIDLMVGKGEPTLVAKFAGFEAAALQQTAAEGRNAEHGSSGGKGAAGSESEEADDEASPHGGNASSSGDELDDVLAQQLTPMSCKTVGGDRDHQSSPMADLIQMMMTPAPPAHISVLDE